MKFVRYVFRGSSSPCPGGGKSRFAFGIWAALLAVAIVVGSVGSALAVAANDILFNSTTLTINGATAVTDKEGYSTFTPSNNNNIPEATDNKVSLTDGSTYVVKDTSSNITDPIEVNGTVNLILCDGVTLTANGEIEIVQNATLNIHVGHLIIADDLENNALKSTVDVAGSGVLSVTGITGNGTLTVAGGTVNSTATAGQGIQVATLTVSGGTVTTMGGESSGVEVTTLNVSGGSLTANGGAGTNGEDSNDGTEGAPGITAQIISITGGTVTATGGKGGTGADSKNGGAGGSGLTVQADGSLSITGGTVTATGGEGGDAGNNNGSAGEAGTDIDLNEVTPTITSATVNGVAYDSDGKATYTIIFDPNNGTWAEGTENLVTEGGENDKVVITATATEAGYSKGATVTAPATNPTQNDKVFTGWSLTATEQTAFNFTTGNVTDNTTFYAMWADAVTITFNRNATDDDNVTTTQVVAKNTATALDAFASDKFSEFTKVGYHFKEWNTTKTGSAGTKYTDGVNVTAESALTLYAQWDANTYNITYDANGGDGTLPNNVTNNGYTFGTTELSFPDTEALTKGHYTFAGWSVTQNATTATYTNTDGGKTLSASDVEGKANNETITLYAVWTPESHSITWTLGTGGAAWPTSNTEGNATTYSYSTTNTVINLVEPEWSGYNFAGWIGDNVSWINEDATTLTIPANTAEDLTFTATWRKAGAFTPATGDNANKPEVAYHSMVLGGQLSVMFYVYFPDYGKDEAATTDILPSNSTVTFTVNGVSESYNANIATPAKVITDGQYTLHGYECFISSVEMADDIVMTLTCDANDEYRAGKELQTYKALTYLNALTGSNSGESEAAKNLGKAIMDYGYYVQPMLAAANGWTLDAENSHTTMTQGNDSITVATANDLSEYKITVKKADDTDTDYSPSEETTITNVGFSLFLDNVTTIRLYLKPKESTATITAIMPNGDEHTALAEATDAEATTKTGYEGYYTLDIENVAAHELGEMFDVTVKVNGTDDMKISVSGLSYVHSVLSSNSYTESTTPTKTVMENAVTALYNYYTATTQYQAAITNYPEYVGQTDEGN